MCDSVHSLTHCVPACAPPPPPQLLSCCRYSQSQEQGPGRVRRLGEVLERAEACGATHPPVRLHSYLLLQLARQLEHEHTLWRRRRAAWHSLGGGGATGPGARQRRSLPPPSQQLIAADDDDEDEDDEDARMGRALRSVARRALRYTQRHQLQQQDKGGRLIKLLRRLSQAP
jgi:hypothetical protein